jgi:hypothetical protein
MVLTEDFVSQVEMFWLELLSGLSILPVNNHCGICYHTVKNEFVITI